MVNNEYLYGTNDVPEIPSDVVAGRLALLHKQLNLVMNVSYLERDNGRKNALLKAIKFWENINGKY